ncbi:MAG: hypothetical protein ACPGQM_07265 [Alphaproteobacteria bacterium]
MQTLLTALASLRLMDVNDGTYSNSPAAEAFLVNGAKYDFGDYLRMQVDRQMYGLMDQIEFALSDDMPEDATASYDDWFPNRTRHDCIPRSSMPVPWSQPSGSRRAQICRRPGHSSTWVAAPAPSP